MDVLVKINTKKGMTKILKVKSTVKRTSIIITLMLLLFNQACKKSDSTDGKLLQASNSVESKILALLPSEFFDNGYSRSGLLDGDAQIFFTKDALNVSYLIMGQQEVMEKGIPLNIYLVTNRSGRKILKGEWDNLTAGDGIFIVYLDKGNVGVQIEGQNGANWLYRAEKKVDQKLYKKLTQLFYGYENYQEEEVMNDSIKYVFTEKIKKLQESNIGKSAEGRNIKMDVFFGDLNADGSQDALVDYCIEATDNDRGDGNAMIFMECWKSGFAVYKKTGDKFFLEADISKDELASEGLDLKVDKIQNGKMFCSNLTWGPDDMRCCPTIKQTIFLLFKNHKIIKPKQKAVISQQQY
jgi:hypothetical protein